MKFRYKLQKIVDLKSNEKAQAEWLLSGALAKLKLEEQSREELLQLRKSIEDQIDRATGEGISAADLVMLQQYLQHVDKLIEHKTESVRQAQRDVDEKSRHLVDAMKDEKVWMKARERSMQAFKAAFLRQEQAILDEMAIARFGKL
jgi:flagellar FliJ protein